MKRAVICLQLTLICLLVTGCILIQPEPTPTPEPTAVPTLTPTPLPELATPAGFRQFLATIEAAQFADRPFLLNQYWAQIEETPLVDSSSAVFLYRGEATDIALSGDMTSFLDDRHIPLNTIDGTDLWWYEGQFEPTARLDYQFVVDEQRILDPRNPRNAPSGMGANSELRMADYVAPPALSDPETYPAGTVTEHTLDSTFLGQRRTFLVYEPVSRQIGVRPAVLIMQDGAEAVNLINMPRLLDTLIGRREVLPLIVVFVPPFDRLEEYWRNDNYADFLAQEVLPFVQDEYETETTADKTGLLGASLGGLISLHTAMRYPDTFGLVAAQSSAFVAEDDSIINELAQSDVLPLKIDLIVGTYEKSVAPGLFPDPDFHAANQRMAAVLEEKGYDYRYREFPEGHSWGLWRAQIGPALDFLYR